MRLLCVSLERTFADYVLTYLDVYCSSFPNEPKLYKAVVYIVYMLETVCAVIITYDLCHMFTDPSYYPFLSHWVASFCGATGM